MELHLPAGPTAQVGVAANYTKNSQKDTSNYVESPKTET